MSWEVLILIPSWGIFSKVSSARCTFRMKLAFSISYHEDISMLGFLQLHFIHSWEHICVCLWTPALLAHARLDWLHAYLHMMNFKWGWELCWVEFRTQELLRCELCWMLLFWDFASLWTSNYLHYFWTWKRNDIFISSLLSAFLGDLTQSWVLMVSYFSCLGGMASICCIQVVLFPLQQFLRGCICFYLSPKLVQQPQLQHTCCLSILPPDKQASNKWQELEIEVGTKYFLESWATEKEMSWHKKLKNTKVDWMWAPGGRQAALASNKCALMHSYHIYDSFFPCICCYDHSAVLIFAHKHRSLRQRWSA